MTASRPLSHSDRDIRMTYKEFKGKMKYSFLLYGILEGIETLFSTHPELFKLLEIEVILSKGCDYGANIIFFHPESRLKYLSLRMEVTPLSFLASAPQEIAEDILSEISSDHILHGLPNLYPEKSYPAIRCVSPLYLTLSQTEFNNATSIAHWAKRPGQFKFKRGEQTLWVTVHHLPSQELHHANC